MIQHPIEIAIQITFFKHIHQSMKLRSSLSFKMYYFNLNTSRESDNEREEVGHTYLHTHTYKPIMKFSKGRKKINEGKRCNKNYAIILNVFIQGIE